MTKSKKALVVAGAAALGLVAATGVTSGLAWFATNSTVTVTGMAVTANTTDAFLLIAKGSVEPDTASTGVRALNATTANAAWADVNLKPVTYTGAVDVATGLTTTAIELADQEDSTKYKWGTGSSASVNDANTSSAITKIAKTSGDAPKGTFKNDVVDAGYVGFEEFSVCLATGSAGCDGLKISAVDMKDKTSSNSVWATTGLTVIIATSYAGKQFTTTAASDETVIWNTAMTSSDTTSVKIRAYVYIDGTSAGVKTAAVTNLAGTVGFSISTYKAS